MTRDVTSAADTCQLGLICGEGPRHVTEKPNFLSQNIQYLSLVLEYLELTRGGLFQIFPYAYLIIVADAADAVSVNFSGRCKFLQI